MPHWTELELTGVELTTHVLVHGAPFVFEVSVFEPRSADGGAKGANVSLSKSVPVRTDSIQRDISIQKQ